MIDGNVNAFLDHVTYEEVAVLYNQRKYFFHGLLRNVETQLYEFTIDLWDDKDWYVETVYYVQAETAEACMNCFLTKPIIDGKKFWDIEREMTWIDW